MVSLSWRKGEVGGEGQRLRYSAARGVMTEDLRSELSARKDEVLTFLRGAIEQEHFSTQTIQPASRDRNVPLSFAQQRLWFLNELVPGNPFYNEFIGLRLNVHLNIKILEQSLKEIVRRHEALRTTFSTTDGGPVQVISPILPLPLNVIDLRRLPAAEREAEAIRLATEETRLPFDLASGPLVRTSLLQMGEADYAFLLIMHHIISDTWSLGIFFQELTTLYNAFALGRPSPLAELAIQYADYAVWQREWLQGEVLEGQLNYWREQLRELPLLQMPTDRARPAVQTFRGAQLRLEIAPTLVTQLRQLSQREGVTPFMTMMAAFKVLLYRYTGQDDIVVGSYIAGRNRAEIEGLIGFFINTQVLRTDLSGDPTFLELLVREHEVAVGAYAHQDVPFEMVVEKLQPDRELNRNPLFQVVFQLQNMPTTGERRANTTQPSFEINRSTAIFDMSVNLWETGNDIKGEIEYNTDLFDEATIERLARHYRRLLESIVAHSDQPISQLSLLSASEERQLVREWNQTATDYPRASCIHQLFEAQVQRSPEAVAVIFENQQLSYGELNRRANQLAGYLQQEGVGVETLVGVMVERSVELVISLLAVLKAGGAYVPLDASYPAERLQYMMADAGVAVVITQSGLAPRLAESGVRVVSIDGQWPEIEQQSAANVASSVRAENLAYVIYTSGSTGRPKGALGTHRAALNRFSWMWKTYPFEASEICCQKTSISFVDSIWEIFGPLLQGVANVIISEQTLK